MEAFSSLASSSGHVHEVHVFTCPPLGIRGAKARLSGWQLRGRWMPEGPSPVSHTPTSRTLAWAPARVQTICRPILPLVDRTADIRPRKHSRASSLAPLCSMACGNTGLLHLSSPVGLRRTPSSNFQARYALRQVRRREGQDPQMRE